MKPGAASDAWAPDAAPEIPAPKRFDPAWLGSQLSRLLGGLRGRRLCVAYSGGLDSSALLAALAALRRRERFALRALHVDHRLQPLSGQWAREARLQSRRLRVVCQVLRPQIAPERGESLEAAARAARYAALARRVRGDELLLTAHHQEDQLETVLLALLRGSGVRGLSAMRPVSRWAGGWLVRPLLPVTRAQLEHYARLCALTWSEDASNADARFDRNFLRREVVPVIRQRWPAAGATVARSAAHLAEARVLLQQLAVAALQPARDGATLRASVLRRLEPPQRRNAVREWLAERALVLPDQRRLREICGSMLDARADAVPAVRWRGGEVRRHNDRLIALSGSVPTRPCADLSWDWRAQPWLALPGGGAIGLLRDPHGGVDLAALPALLSVQMRRGGERLGAGRGRASLKSLLQAHGIAPWQRALVPLIVHRQRIVAVADLWLDRSLQIAASTDAERGRFRWRRSAGYSGAGD